MIATVLAVHFATERPDAGFAKPTRAHITRAADHGVSHDIHAGTRDLRQVHLIDVARYDLLRASGHDVGPGHLGENVTTAGIDLLALTTETVLLIGDDVVLCLTGMRFPRHEDPATDPIGLSLDGDGVPVGRVGVFATVVRGGEVRSGDVVRVEPSLHPSPLTPL